jgi:hypothetical protein
MLEYPMTEASRGFSYSLRKPQGRPVLQLSPGFQEIAKEEFANTRPVVFLFLFRHQLSDYSYTLASTTGGSLVVVVPLPPPPPSPPPNRFQAQKHAPSKHAKTTTHAMVTPAISGPDSGQAFSSSEIVYSPE